MEIKYLEKIFEGCLYMGVAAGHLTNISGTNVRFPYLWRLDTKFSFFSQAVLEMFEQYQQQTDARAKGQTLWHRYAITLVT